MLGHLQGQVLLLQFTLDHFDHILLELKFISKAEYDVAMADTEAVYERIAAHDAEYLSSKNVTSGTYFSDALYVIMFSMLKLTFSPSSLNTVRA